MVPEGWGEARGGRERPGDARVRQKSDIVVLEA